LLSHLLHLPAGIEPLSVALVYNQKKEDHKNKSGGEDSTDPPRFATSGTTHAAIPSSSLSLHTETQDFYAEWDTFETIDAVRNALAERHEVTLIEADEKAYVKLLEQPPDIVFNIAEGLYGVSREAQIPAILEFLRIPYTGSDPLTLAICLDKSRTKEILAHAKIPTTRFAVVSNLNEIRQFSASFPCIVKPLHEGSSKGIFNSSVVNTAAELRRELERVLTGYSEPALVEEFLIGREFTVAILGNPGEITVLPIVEIIFDSLPAGVNHIYSFEAKWIWDNAEAPLDIFQCPARLTGTLQEQIENICRKAYKLLRCRDWCRIDVRLDRSGNPHIIELNPLPGILPNPEDNSCFPKAARAAGLGYNKLIQTVLACAAKRYGLDRHKPPHAGGERTEERA